MWKSGRPGCFYRRYLTCLEEQSNNSSSLALEQAAISKRAERLKEYKEYIEDLPEKDTKRILKELAILEKIRAQK